MEKIYIDKFEEIEKEYNEILTKLSDSAIISNQVKYTEFSKQEKKLKPRFDIYQKYKSLMEENKDILKIIQTDNDAQLVSELKKQKNSNDQLLLSIEQEAIDILKEKDPLDERDVVFEINGAVGGSEANIFAGDLFWMYQKYCSKNNFQLSILNSEPNEQGGFSYISFEVSGGINPYGVFKYESGIHRVQRIPVTENKGRVHTSTVSVLVLPKAEEIDFVIKNDDLKIETYKSGGAGGQHVNKTESAVRITYKPTGLVVASQEGRSQHSNKDKAMELLRSKLFEQKLEKEAEAENAQRKLKTGSRERSDKIRTYNYPDNRVTDHRIGLTLNKLDRIIDGSALNEILEALSAYNVES